MGHRLSVDVVRRAISDGQYTTVYFTDEQMHVYAHMFDAVYESSDLEMFAYMATPEDKKILQDRYAKAMNYVCRQAALHESNNTYQYNLEVALIAKALHGYIDYTGEVYVGKYFHFNRRADGSIFDVNSVAKCNLHSVTQPIMTWDELNDYVVVEN